jgi:hypothetical protein
MGGTDSEDHKLALYRTTVNSRKWPLRILFHFLLAATLNSHILFKLDKRINSKHKLYCAGDFIEETADQMKKTG